MNFVDEESELGLYEKLTPMYSGQLGTKEKSGQTIMRWDNQNSDLMILHDG